MGKALDAAATEGDPQLIGAGGAVVCHWLSHLLAQRYAMPRIPTPSHFPAVASVSIGGGWCEAILVGGLTYIGRRVKLYRSLNEPI